MTDWTPKVVPGTPYDHQQFGRVTVERVEDGVVVLSRPDWLNTRQQPIAQFCAQAMPGEQRVAVSTAALGLTEHTLR